MLLKGITLLNFLGTLAIQVGSAEPISSACVFLSEPNGGFECPDSFVSASFGSISAGKQLTGDARATAGYTQLSVTSSASFSLSAASVAHSDAIAFLSDSIKIDSPTLRGSSGRVLVNYTIGGTIVTSGAGSSSVEVAVEVNAAGTPPYWTSYTSSTPGISLVSQGFTFVFGQPFGIQFCLGSVTGAGVLPSGGGAPGNHHVTTFVCAAQVVPTTGSGSAAADFAFGILPMTVSDTLGNPVLDAQFTSASGTQYGVVPEGSSLVMLGLGLMGLAVVHRNIRHHHGVGTGISGHATTSACE